MKNDDWNDQLRDKLFEIVHSKKGRTGNIIKGKMKLSHVSLTKIIPGEYFLPLPQHITNYIILGVLGILFILVLIFRRIIRYVTFSLKVVALIKITNLILEKEKKGKIILMAKTVDSKQRIQRMKKSCYHETTTNY